MKFVFSTLIVFLSVVTYGQALKKNAVKINVLGPATQVYSLQYERKFDDNLSLINTFFFRPKTVIPFGNKIDQVAKKRGLGLTGLKFEYIFMNEAKVGVKGFSPELRYYFGSNKNRMFASVFGQYEQFQMVVPALLGVKYQGLIADVKAPNDFRFQAFSGGLIVGRQFNFNHFGLDFVIIGPHFGIANKFVGSAQNSILQKLNEPEKTYLKDKVIERFGLSDKYFNLEIAGEKAEFKSVRNIPYFGIRGFGLNASYSF
jgi:Protein of unknown function (DUF3575)